MSFLDTVSAEDQRRLLVHFCRTPSFRRTLYKADSKAFRDLTNAVAPVQDNSKDKHA